jgi:uncharacterized membrane protein YhhN
VGAGVFIASLVLGAAYWAVWCYRDKGLAGLLVKTGSVALLAVWALLTGGPLLLVGALALSAVGDAFLAGKAERWLLPGMAAFFLAHAVYVPLFWQLGEGGWTWPVKAGQAVLVIGGVIFLRWLAPFVEPKMRGPVILYTGVILMMGAAAIALPGAYWLATLGALMFIASDVILSLLLFRQPKDQPANVPASLAVWGLYFGGQVLIALGITGSLAA